MSLIVCPECGHQISEYAKQCVYCGCPMEKIVEISKKNNAEEQKKKFYEKLDSNQKLIADKFIEKLQSVFDPFYKANYKHYLLLGEGYYYRNRVYCYFCFEKNGSLVLKYDENGIRHSISLNVVNFEDSFKKIVKIYNENQRNEPNQNLISVGNEAYPKPIESTYSNVNSGEYYVIRNEADGTYFENATKGESFVGRDDIGLGNRETYEIANFGMRLESAQIFHTEEGAKRICEKLLKDFPKTVVVKITK